MCRRSDILPPMHTGHAHHPQGVPRSKARPRFNAVPKHPTAQWAARDAETASDAEVVRFDFVVGAQFLGFCGIHDLAFAHHVDVIDELKSEMRVLLDQQYRETFLFQSTDRFPKALYDDRRQPL